jgi:hypothetical protein
MTIERFIAVALPLQASYLCTVKRAKASTLILACCILLINIHFTVTHSLIKRHGEIGCQSKNETFDFFINNIWPWIDASIYSFIPMSLLLIFNLLIVLNLMKASRNIQKFQKQEAYENSKCKFFNFNSSFIINS